MVIFRSLGLKPYLEVWQQMKEFTQQRSEATPDECWLLEHPAVYTLGQAGKKEHLLQTNDIAVVQSDRGGQVTYHGPGQLIAYTLFDLRRRQIGIRTLVTQLEQVIIELLASYNIPAAAKAHAPGVYVAEKKIASLGLRVKNGCTYHGLALNVAMDLSPFAGINPCGVKQLGMTQMHSFVATITLAEAANHLTTIMAKQFGS